MKLVALYMLGDLEIDTICRVDFCRPWCLFVDVVDVWLDLTGPSSFLLLDWTGTETRTKGSPVRRKMTRGNWRPKQRRWEVGAIKTKSVETVFGERRWTLKKNNMYISSLVPALAEQISWGGRMRRSCPCWRRRCSSSEACGRAWVLPARRSRARPSRSSGRPAVRSCPGGLPSWKTPCRRVRGVDGADVVRSRGRWSVSRNGALALSQWTLMTFYSFSLCRWIIAALIAPASGNTVDRRWVYGPGNVLLKTMPSL